LRAVSVGMISVECRRTNFNSYTNLGPPVKLFQHYAFSSLGTNVVRGTHFEKQ